MRREILVFVSHLSASAVNFRAQQQSEKEREKEKETETDRQLQTDRQTERVGFQEWRRGLNYKPERRLLAPSLSLPAC
jgi:Ni/Co efflux regulator RcnB